MGYFERDIDITSNIKSIESLKSELLSSVASLFKALTGGYRENLHDSVSDILSSIILICYVLAKRLGMNYNSVESKMRNKVRLGLIESDGTEKNYGDLTELSKHLDSSRNNYQTAGAKKNNE
jgi:hypothetical protein